MTQDELTSLIMANSLAESLSDTCTQLKAERDCLREQLTIATAGLVWCESTHAIDWEYRMRAETALREIKMAAIRRRMLCGPQK